MTHIAEEYKVNRLRGITQMLEMSDRQEGRGQEPWIQKKIMKDLLRENPYLKTVQEMKSILKTELKVEVQEAAERYKPWTTQTGMAEQTQMKQTKGEDTAAIRTHSNHNKERRSGDTNTPDTNV